MDEDERSELVAELFYVMIVGLEEAAGLAADGQGRGVGLEQLMAYAARIHGAAQRVAIIADAATAILEALPAISA